MLIHTLIVAVSCAALVAFVTLWYFWVKKRMEASCLLQDDQNVLLPFRHFSWILLGLIVITCLAQVHFVRVSATVHERLASIGPLYQSQEHQAQVLEELRANVERLRKETSHSLRDLRAQIPQQIASLRAAQTLAMEVPGDVPAERDLPLADRPRKRHVETDRAGFGREAKAFSAGKAERSIPKQAKVPPLEKQPVQSMQLSRSGQVAAENLSVRKLPTIGSEVIETLNAGQEIKVTEKLLLKQTMWFKVITPSGRAGWVEFHYVKLGGNA